MSCGERQLMEGFRALCFLNGLRGHSRLTTWSQQAQRRMCQVSSWVSAAIGSGLSG